MTSNGFNFRITHATKFTIFDKLGNLSAIGCLWPGLVLKLPSSVTTAIITDSAKGIWKALARNGFNVATNGLLSEKAKLDEVVAIGVQCLTYMADVSSEQDVKAMIMAVLSDFGGINVVRHLLIVLTTNTISEPADGHKPYALSIVVGIGSLEPLPFMESNTSVTALWPTATAYGAIAVAL
ncbi:hypothetical protein ARMSODRAFT_975975 [Armillaria solidipes]|uniref:NAD(P)-binding protein n=1 Tax=Armillaria solidipes TaxID=1076256 RepID=A0A2H3BXG3_9AGAR|nr:hypothetical protein ARMSODRAFT_975975 [Armillaria solidipes]